MCFFKDPSHLLRETGVESLQSLQAYVRCFPLLAMAVSLMVA